MSDKSSIRDTFFEECEELLEALTEGLSGLEADPTDDDIVNAVFRAVHSIKGGAGAFGLDDLVSFAHRFETVLDRVRDHELAISPELMRIFHRSGDQLTDLVEAARFNTLCDAAHRDSVLAELDAYLGDAAEEEEFSFDGLALSFDAPDPMADIAPDPVAEPQPAAMPAGCTRYEIRFRPFHALYTLGHEPANLFEHLAELGQLEARLDLASVPAFDRLERDDTQLSWRLFLTSDASRQKIEDVFEFVESLCELDISENGDPSPPPPGPGPAKAVPITAETAAPPPPPEAPSGEPAPPAQARDKETAPPKATLRVDLDRVDRLINTVGELIINQAMITQCIEELDLPPTSQIFNEIEDYKLLARDIQEGVMAIRAQPVKPLFQRMARIVREASEATGKNSRLLTVGENTEVDKTVIERLADPLTHMIRNAVDHGLESPEARAAAGKEPVGTIRLTASHRSGSVVLEISDDGAGINRAAVRRKAIEKGLISEDAELSETEIDNLLFAPGFSTAAEVSNLSGRGVGMDVVKTEVQRLGGRITVSSTQGEGSAFSIVLPLTLAVMDGFVVSVADETMVVPISSILETVSAAEQSVHVMGRNERLLLLRGRYVPIVNVAESLQLESTRAEGDQIYLIVEGEAQGLCALEIGEIHDQRQIVVKSLDTQFGSIPGISAATILGDGKIALILDTDQVARRSSLSSPETMALIQQLENEHV